MKDVFQNITYIIRYFRGYRDINIATFKNMSNLKSRLKVPTMISNYSGNRLKLSVNICIAKK